MDQVSACAHWIVLPIGHHPLLSIVFPRVYNRWKCARRQLAKMDQLKIGQAGKFPKIIILQKERKIKTRADRNSQSPLSAQINEH